MQGSTCCGWFECPLGAQSRVRECTRKCYGANMLSSAWSFSHIRYIHKLSFFKRDLSWLLASQLYLKVLACVCYLWGLFPLGIFWWSMKFNLRIHPYLCLLHMQGVLIIWGQLLSEKSPLKWVISRWGHNKRENLKRRKFLDLQKWNKIMKMFIFHLTKCRLCLQLCKHS